MIIFLNTSNNQLENLLKPPNDVEINIKKLKYVDCIIS